MKLSREEFKISFKKKYENLFSEELSTDNKLQQYYTLGSMIKEYLSENWIESKKTHQFLKEKQVYYFSMEFLIGRLMTSNLINLGILNEVVEALKELDIDYYELENEEKDAGLGNGGLGRLAACFMDSIASLGIPGHGIGIRYNYGFFEQKIINGYQVEVPDNWLKDGNIWETRRDSEAVLIKYGGNVKAIYGGKNIEFDYENNDIVKAVPYDTPIIGYDNNTVNTLRLWSAEVADESDFNFESFNSGKYLDALEYKSRVEAISQILYPDDSTYEGRLLRLKQQYFFVSAGLQNILRVYKRKNRPIEELPKHIAIHINDTHPSLCIPELMRILLDEEELDWDDAWKITINVMAYTNHTILAEALEKWPVDMFKSLLPRIYMIVEEINRRFCEEISSEHNERSLIDNMSILLDGKIKMAHLAIVGSHSVNGVAKLHTEILKHQELKNFYELYPNKFNNKTNGITHRRWLIESNPKLTKFLKNTIGDSFIKNPLDLSKLMEYKFDTSVKNELYNIKRENKILFTNYLKKEHNIVVDPISIFDVQVKRLHAYKRQILNVFNILDLYYRLKENSNLDIVPRTFFFGAKASPSYHLAKETIKFINTVANMINNDINIKGKIKIVFLENYRVSLAEKIFPASDVSEQISLATKEASGTGNMKFMMNGAVTIATMDGANIEIHDQVGSENIVIFGMKDKDVLEYYKNRNYISYDFYNSDPRIKRILDNIANGSFGVSQWEFNRIHQSLIEQNDEYFVLKDFDEYVKAQDKIDKLYKNKDKWSEMCLINIAKSGVFSSDNTIKQYANEIWNIKY